MLPKQYVGDGVYIERDRYGAVWLTTENGLGTTNTIMLEPETLHNLLLILGE